MWLQDDAQESQVRVSYAVSDCKISVCIEPIDLYKRVLHIVAKPSIKTNMCAQFIQLAIQGDRHHIAFIMLIQIDHISRNAHLLIYNMFMQL